jgi:colanic acid biosynthesis glycosyl transferase WcaI
MKFILYSLNYSPELTGIGKYNGEMCSELAKMGMDIVSVVAPPYYPEWKVPENFPRYYYSTSTVEGVSVIRCPLYVPEKVTTIKRLIHLTSFALSSGLAILSQFSKKADIIFLVQPTFFCAPMTLLVAKLTGAKAVMHIQDFEVDAMFGLGMVREGKVSQFVRKIESFLLKRFDLVSSISYSMLKNAQDKGVDPEKLLFFPNWADTHFVTPDIDGSTMRREFGFTAEDKIVLYAGNIGAKQGLEIVIDAAQDLSSQSSVKFVFVGTGAYVDILKTLAQDKALTNVYFKPLQPWARVPEMLAMADIHLVVQKKGAADAVLPSKLTNILSVGGHALVTAEFDTELGQLAQKYPTIYQRVEPESVDDFIAGLNSLLSRDLSQTNSVARCYAEQYLNKDVILQRFYQDMQGLVASSK